MNPTTMSGDPTTKTIVIADDDVDLVQALQGRCEARGLCVHAAYDGLGALNLIHDVKPDVICLDVNMPAGGGLGVLEMLCGASQLVPTPTIVVTADAGEDTIRRCHRYGAYYVEKCPDLWARIEPLVQELTIGAPAGAPADEVTSANREPI